MAERVARPAALRRARKAALKPPSPEAVLEVVFALAKELSLDLREEELIGTFAGALKRLLPGRLLCVRVVDPRSGKLTSMIADGALKPHAAEAPLAIKRSALSRTHLDPAVTASERVCVQDAYQPIFEGAGGGFSVPLVASGELFGLLNVEVGTGVALLAADEPVVIPLANQLSVALRNLSLLGEARYYRDYLRQTIDVANALISVVDRDGKVAVVNAAMQRYLGEGTSLVGFSLHELRARSDAPEPRLSTLFLDGLRGIEHSDRELTIPTCDGRQRRAVFNTSVLRAPDGSIDGVIGIGQDLDRVRALERQVIQAEKLATLGQLAAGVVHELNNPLTSISVYADYLTKLLEKSGAAAADLEKARRVVEGAARIQKLTRDLMSYARPSGELESVAPNEVVRQAMSFCQHLFERVEAHLELELAEGLPRVRAIPSQLHQVLINLVTNACHALPAPDQTVRITTCLDEGGRIRISVADSGVGIDAFDQSHVFEPFFTTKKEGKGTGLGLSIVKNIVEGHGGQITFESRVGAGTTFHILLPKEERT